MASTKKVNSIGDRKAKSTLVIQIEQLEQQLEQRLKQYKKVNGTKYPLELVDTTEKTKEEYDYINPAHYVQEDGRQTWERMLDSWSLEEVALWCEMTAFKYLDRMGKKPNEDMDREKKKIKWYEDKAKELREKEAKKNIWS